MVKVLIISVFLTLTIAVDVHSQNIVEVVRKYKIVCSKKSGGSCKVKSSYKKKRSAGLRLTFKKSGNEPYKYAYVAKNSAPPKAIATPVAKTITPVHEKIKHDEGTTANTPTTKPASQPDTPILLTNSKLKNMTPDQRKKEVQDMPPTRSLPPVRFISAQDEFSVANMDSFMEALELVKEGKMLLIEGHTDDLGSDDYNLKLSMKRVEKIRQLMLSAGASDDLISIIGYGEKKPLVPNTSEKNRETNRRIEFKIYDLDK